MNVRFFLLFMIIYSVNTPYAMQADENITCAEALVMQQLGQPLLYAPWRESYANRPKPTHNICAFCAQLAEQQDEKHLILVRHHNFAIMMNLYPYCEGHLMIVPYKHIPDINHLLPEERAALMEVINSCTEVLQKVMNPDGINIGINKGKAAGASIPDHLHVHIVPRKHAVENFFQILSKARVITYDMHDLYKRLKKAFNEQ